jgi:hypothetical protein
VANANGASTRRRGPDFFSAPDSQGGMRFAGRLLPSSPIPASLVERSFGCRRVRALVVFFSVNWLPANDHWASGLVPYPLLLAIQLVMLAAMIKIVLNVRGEEGFFAELPASASHFLIGFSAVYAGSMALRYAAAMVFRPDMRWLGGTIPIFFHFVLAAFLYIWGKALARRPIFARP